MRFSPTKLLHGLLYTAPVLLLTLVACGGGGDSTTPPFDVYYTVSGTTSGLTSSGLILRNNGGDDQPVNGVISGVTGFSFPAINTSYNVTVLSHPDTPTTQKCTVGSGSGPRQSGDISSVTVSCVDAFTISGTISGLSGTSTGLVLQNNDVDNYLVPAGATGTFAFSTPLISGDAYNVTVLSHPHNPNQTCIPSLNTGTVPTGVNGVTITCGPYSPPPLADPYVYAVNNGSTGTNGVSSYVSTGGALSTQTFNGSGSGPYSIAIDPASKHAYVANYNSNSISAYSIDGAGALTLLTDVDAGTYGVQTSIATGNGPRKIVIHPSGKFAYVVNSLSNNVSAYSIDTDPNSVTFGALAKIDADAAAAGTQFIATSVLPISIAVDPAGGYVYVANVGSTSPNVCGRGANFSTNGCISAYSIDATTGALTAINLGAGFFIDTGITPKSIIVDPAGNHVYVTNSGSTSVSVYDIGGSGTLTQSTPASTGLNPNSVVIHPGGGYAYVTNYGEDNVTVYTIASGALTNPTTVPAGTGPISISIDSTGQYAYVANSGSGDISAYSISGGALAQVNCITGCNGNNFKAGTKPYAVTTAR